MSPRILWILAVVVAGVLVGCGRKPAEEVPRGPREGGVITILGKDNFYEPKDVAILVGVEYEFIFRNVGISVHNLVIESQAAGGRVISSDIVVDAGAESRFKVRIDTEGTYRMQCTYHPEMTGQVRVVREVPR